MPSNHHLLSSPCFVCKGSLPSRRTSGWGRSPEEIRDVASWAFPSEAATATKSLQSCPTLCDPMDCSPPGSSVHGIFPARVLEWGAIAFLLLLWSKALLSQTWIITTASYSSFCFSACPLSSFSTLHKEWFFKTKSDLFFFSEEYTLMWNSSHSW